MIGDTYHDLETRSPVPIKHGTHRYAEKAEVLLWSYATSDNAPVQVWDKYSDPEMPLDLAIALGDPDNLVWFHNGGQFDFVVLEHAEPQIAAMVPWPRRRDTMVQAYCHGLPGKLDTLGHVLKLNEDKRKLSTGRALMRLFCIPDKATGEYNRPEDYPEKWEQFKDYAGRDIEAMRQVHLKVPMWNYKGAELDLWHLDMKINFRGVAVDQDLARAAVRAAKASLNDLAEQADDLTDGAVSSATQRDALLKWILEEHGVNLPDMRADTLERRLADESLPQAVRDLIAVRLQASMNSASKYTALLNGVSSDGRLRGLAQFCGASRTGRWAHRLFQPGNLMRPPIDVIAEFHRIKPWQVTEDHIHQFVTIGIEAMLCEAEHLIFSNVRALAGTCVRGAIIALEHFKLVIADLANIEGRVAAWIAGDEAKLQKFRDYDTIVGFDEVKKKDIRKGPDLYVVAYASSFNVAIESVSKDMRQIGKVEELMFQYQGGVGAWITGAATYGIDLAKMTEAVWPVLPEEVKAKAESYMRWRYEKFEKLAVDKLAKGEDEGDVAMWLDEHLRKERYGLPEKVFIACDAIKRLWRAAHPEISSIWDLLESTVIAAILSPGNTLECRKWLKVRCDGSWLRIRLPSGRCLCYPFARVKKDKIMFVGMDPYTKTWRETSTYGGKLFENVVQAVARDVLAANMHSIEEAGYAIAFSVHDELVTETPDAPEFNSDDLSERMARVPEWAGGLPLAAAGFETKRYYKG